VVNVNDEDIPFSLRECLVEVVLGRTIINTVLDIHVGTLADMVDLIAESIVTDSDDIFTFKASV
jgi:hypothetical protein